MAGTAMKIRWVLRHNPQNRLLPPKYYAAPVFAGRRDAGEMIRQIAGRSVLSAGDIVDAFANAGEVAANWLAAGCSVELPEIGSLLLEFSSEGFDDPADFRPESLRGTASFLSFPAIDESDKIAIEHIFTGIGPVVFGFSPVCFGENIREKFRFGSTKLKKQALVFRKRYGRIF